MPRPPLPTVGGDNRTWAQKLDAVMVDLRGSADAAESSLAEVNPATSSTPGKVWIQGPSSPKFDDMETVILDHVIERSDTPATNRVNMQTLLDNIGSDRVRVFIPPRWDEYGEPDPILLSRETGGQVRVLDVPSHTVIEGAGAGTTLKIADDQSSFTRVFNVGREAVSGVHDVAIRNLRIDGNKANNAAPGTGEGEDTHHAAIFVYGAERVEVENVEVVNCTGDAVQITGGTSTPSREVLVRRVRATDNLRNPVTVEQAEEVWIDKCYLICPAESIGQAVDSEPYGDAIVGTVWVTDSVLGHDDPARYVLSAAGKSATYPRRRMVITGNEFRNGRLHVYSIEDLILANNTGAITRTSIISYIRRGLVSGNIWDVTTADNYAFQSAYTLSQKPEYVLFSDNQITMTNNGGGYRLEGVSNHKIRGGFVRRSGTTDTGYHGVSISATQNMENIEVTGLEIYNYFTPVRGVPVSTNTLNGLLIGGLTIDGSGSGYAAIDLYSAATWISNLVIPPSVVRNNVGPALTLHTGTPYVISGVPRWRAVWSCSGTPEGQITERIGAVAYRRDGGAGTTMYVKESGTDTNTGWVAK